MLKYCFTQLQDFFYIVDAEKKIEREKFKYIF